MMRLEQIDHVALRCASLEATKNWYTSVLGFEHIYQEHGNGIPVFLRLGSTYLTLFPDKGDEQPSGRIWHFAFRAATLGDFRSAQADLQARGIPFQFRDHEIAHSIYFSDPDGILLEITTYDISTNGDGLAPGSLAPPCTPPPPDSTPDSPGM
ncbi:MAG TPA: VOC family protein [Bacteroidia bacterium]|nr:VOC family protein [Bacteroidia bacterium]